MKIYDFIVNDTYGFQKKLSDFEGKVLLVVNTASKCGFTPQYKGLEKLYEKYKDEGFEILAFPANNFLNQEPGSNEEIREFCSTNYDVSFPIFEKISVKGKNQHPLYKYLTEETGEFKGKIRWNFDKFLIDREGNVINRFKPKIKPESIEKQIHDALET
jgi:glutathione peroxidase